MPSASKLAAVAGLLLVAGSHGIEVAVAATNLTTDVQDTVKAGVPTIVALIMVSIGLAALYGLKKKA